jgi:hypothetical protein
MLDIQREKFEMRDRLKAAGVPDAEIKRQLSEELEPFKPAFVNGKRVAKPQEMELTKKNTRRRKQSSSI